ncbi:Capicua transcriptional repressor (Silurana) [Caligus rogercresseyi]|uniref:Capicua transcriptional repressor (Silurana) n=1 Tax=Caligus rogercresseyi TaxID=217165 RepID=A0A7T8HL58_CALRO|nr:Capicua transcriptional repressor (Silurana) [Caligus rogercresseyi]
MCSKPIQVKPALLPNKDEGDAAMKMEVANLLVSLSGGSRSETASSSLLPPSSVFLPIGASESRHKRPAHSSPIPSPRFITQPTGSGVIRPELLRPAAVSQPLILNKVTAPPPSPIKPPS